MSVQRSPPNKVNELFMTANVTPQLSSVHIGNATNQSATDLNLTSQGSAIHTNSQNEITYPIRKLSSVTRMRTKITENRLSTNEENCVLVKRYLNEYIKRMTAFGEACECELQKSVSESSLSELKQWQVEHWTEMKSFVNQTKSWLNENEVVEVNPEDSVSNVGNERTSLVSSSSSLLERKIEAQKRRKFITNNAIIKSKEIEAKAAYEKLQLQLRTEAETLAIEGEQEAIAELEEKMNTTQIGAYAELNNAVSITSDPNIAQVLSKQNDLTRLLIENQARAKLPHHEPDVFDGEDITQYPSFILTFERSIEKSCLTSDDKYYFLLKYTRGQAKELVRSCQSPSGEESYRKARQLLGKKFGNEFEIAHKYLMKLQNWEIIKSEDSSAMEKFGMFLTTCLNSMGNMTSLNQLNSWRDIKELTMKLPYDLRRKFRGVVARLVNNGENMKFECFVNFVNEEVNVMKFPFFGDISDKSLSKVKTVGKNDSKVTNSRSFYTDNEEETSATDLISENTKYQCPCCSKNNHTLDNCFFFAKKSLQEKENFIRNNQLCYGCLASSDHRARNCPHRITCKICEKNHPSSLHRDPQQLPRKYSEEPHDQETRAMNSLLTGKLRVVCAAVPVIIRDTITNKSITTYMALDNFSTASYVNGELAQKLGCRGENTSISITTLENKLSPIETKVIKSLEILSLNGNERRSLPIVYAKKNWPFDLKDSPSPTDLEGFPALKCLPFTFVDEKIGILVGMDMPELLNPLEVVASTKYGPYASKHLFGWALNGPVKGSAQNHNCFRTLNEDLQDCSLDEKVQKYFGQDFVDMEENSAYSFSDERWLELAGSSCITTPDKHFQVSLPLKEPVRELPDNSFYVQRKFELLQRKFRKNDKYTSEYVGLIREMKQRKFIEEVPEEGAEMSSRSAWYLTHHGVRHKQKGKLRIVFDCSLRYRGVSLNDRLLKGPDLTNSILGVLLRFRQYKVAFSADIEKMFYMVKLPESDRDYLRFYWFADDSTLTGIKKYRLTVHVFGATSSPSIANFALRETVNNVNASYEAKNTVLRSFYVDDLLKSVIAEDTAKNLLEEVRGLLAERGFNLTSISSNSRSVLHSVPPSKHSKELRGLDVACEELPCERTLGIGWNVENDSFTFKINLCDQPCTKRGILSTMFTVFDPFFITSPVIIPAKRIFQQACFLKVGWDEKLPQSLQTQWAKWLSQICLLDSFEIPRAYCCEITDPEFELHIFCDGSEIAYGAVAYLRCYSETKVRVTIVSAKVRMTPLNRSSLKTVPRIELNAAKLAVSLYLQVKSELEITLKDLFFWSDSTVVLAYIKSDNGCFHRYVANRVAFIRSHTDPQSWRHVPGTQNPADLLSRGASNIQKFLSDETWREGPSFLKNSQNYWPTSPNTAVLENDPEIKLKNFKTQGLLVVENPTSKLLNSTSNLHKLKRRIAIFLKYKEYLQKKQCESLKILYEDLTSAETELWKYIQTSRFDKQISALRRGEELQKADSLMKLSPFIGDDGLLRVGGRLFRSKLPYATKFPILLPNSELPVSLLIEKLHVDCGHLGREAVLAKLRRKFHIIGSSTAVRKVIRRCMICLKVQGRTSEQYMANLPADRVTGDLPVFSSTGTDFFGPFFVTRGRYKSKEKRYGVIFSCLASRAVHIEVASSLDTSSFINALRRFICRRGPVSLMRSDNGTNLVAGCKEINDSIKRWNNSQIDSFCHGKNIQWIFQPATGSHHGGSVEREVRSIRKVLNSLLQEFENKITISDEFLSTLMCEVEEILNNRPLTKVTSDFGDLEALTPNNLLRLHSDIIFPVGLFDEGDIYVRRKWRQVQFVAEVFWRRWRSEYLQLLQQRQKWTKFRRNHVVGDLVMISDQKLPRNLWCIGKIVSVSRDDAGNVRRAKVSVTRSVEGSTLKIGKTVLERPITKLVLLKTSEEL